MFLLALAFVTWPRTAHGQGSSQPSPPTVDVKTPSSDNVRVYRDITLWGAQSVADPHILGGLDGQRMFAFGARFSQRFYRFSKVNLNGHLEFKPAVVFSQPAAHGERNYFYGAGGSAGLELEKRRWRRLQPFFDMSGGLVIFTRPAPVPEARRLNFTMEVGPGMRIPLRRRRFMKFGLWYFHFSNASTAPRNPGFDGLLLYVGYVLDNSIPTRTTAAN
ncbi:MAG: hypothetical protein C5B56_15830 [Proteobacteria bacterium]|nr:MAG: hypothetical protein C5B56_15830 [Pseudomonadota bacterium]